MDLPNRNVKNQMHHVLINGRWKHDITVKRGADVGSDLHLLLFYSNCQTTVEKKSHQGGRKEAKVQHCYAEKATCQQTVPYSCKKKNMRLQVTLMKRQKGMQNQKGGEQTRGTLYMHVNVC